MFKNQTGLVVGLFMAIVHAIWSLAVAIIPTALSDFLNWILRLHHMQFAFTITPFVFGKALLLVVMTFVIGWIFGSILGWLIRVCGCSCGCCKNK